MLKSINQQPDSRLFTILTLLTICIFTAFFDTILSYNERWDANAESYSHGYLSVLIALYLVFLAIPKIHNQRITTSIAGFVLLFMTNLLWLIGHATQVLFFQQISVPAIVWLTVMAISGWNTAKLFLLPVLIVYLCIPVWEGLIPLLQYLAVEVTKIFLSIFNLNIFVEGNMINTSQGQFVVSSGCSGLNYFLVANTLAIFMIQLNELKAKQAIVVIFMTVILSLVSNWVRITLLVLIGHYTKMQSSLMEDHEIFGWITFLIVLIPMIWFSWKSNPSVQIGKSMNGNKETFKNNYIAISFSIMASISGPVTAWLFDSSAITEGYQPNTSWPEIGIEINEKKQPWKSGFNNQSQTLSNKFNINNHNYFVTIKYYEDQYKESELINIKNKLFNANEKIILEKKIMIISSAFKKTQVKLVHFLDKKTNRKFVLIYWFNIAGYITADKYWAKIYQAIGYFSGRYDASLNTYFSECSNTDCHSHEKNLLKLVENEIFDYG